MIINQIDKVNRDRNKGLPPDDEVVESIDIQENIHKEYGQSVIDNSAPIHPCLTIKEGGQLIPTCEKGREEDILGEPNEEPIIINRHDEHDHAGYHDKYSMQDKPFLEGQTKVQVKVVVMGHRVQPNIETFCRAREFLVGREEL